MKIRTRFTLLFTFIVGIIIFFFSLSIYYLSDEYRQSDFHSRLQDRAVARLKLFMVARTDTQQLLQNNKEDHLYSLINENIIIYDENYNILYRDNQTFTPDAGSLSNVKLKGKDTYKSGDNEIIGFNYNYQGKSYILYASAFDKYGTSYVKNLRKILIVRGFILFFIIFLSGWLYAGRFLKPISKIVQQADQITDTNLNQRLSIPNKHDEIGQLAATFNRMLERLETSINNQKRFVSNASHEIRTPLTAISGQIDVALMKDRSKEEYRSTLQSIQTDIMNLRTLANNLLELANSNVENLFQHSEMIRIDEILWNIRDDMARQKPDYNVHIHFDSLADDENVLICKGEEKLLKTAFINIIDNACKFSENKTVDIRVTFDQSNIILYFVDQGIGMPESYLNHIFEPFYRGHNAHGIPGNGIGLSLVQRIIKLHSGKLFVRSKINEGTSVEVVLPNLS